MENLLFFSVCVFVFGVYNGIVIARHWLWKDEINDEQEM